MFTKRNTWLIAIAAIATLGVTFAACSSGDDAPAEPPTPTADETIDLSGLEITMIRHGSCWGRCQNYTITIREEGDFVYEGQRNVDVVGIRRGEIDLDDVRRLVQRFEMNGFFELPEGGCRWTDAPITTTSVRGGNQDHTVVHCTLDDELSSIEASIDELTNSLQWTGPPKTPDYDFSDS